MANKGQESEVVYGTEDLLTSLCNSVTRVLNVATQCPFSFESTSWYEPKCSVTLTSTTGQLH